VERKEPSHTCNFYVFVVLSHQLALDEIDNSLRNHPVDLAINIQSFSECRTQAIEWCGPVAEQTSRKELDGRSQRGWVPK
jgi:hypothetical protein